MLHLALRQSVFPSLRSNPRSRLLRPSRGVMSRKLFRTFRYRALILLCAGLGCSATAWSQQPSAYVRSSSIDPADSRAEHEAEQMVSLSADTITQILQS